MSPKLGQKIKDNPKDYMQRTRLDKEMLAKLDETAKILGTSRSGVVRRGIDSEYQKAKKNKDSHPTKE